MVRILVIVTLLLGACSSSGKSKAIPADEAHRLLIDRNWLDRWPSSETDRLFVYRFVPSMGGGVFQDRTLFKGTFELFSFEATGDEIRFVLHATKQTVKSHYKIERVDGPAPFDLRLVIDGDPRGPHTYYGMRSETDRDGHLLDERLSHILN